GSGTLTGLGTATVSGGVATQSVTGALAGSITITAGASTLTSDSTTFRIVPGAAGPVARTTWNVDLAAGSPRTLTVEIRDSAGNLVTGDNLTVVTFAKTSGSGSVTGLGTATASGGVATHSITGALAGTITITASTASLTSDSTTFRIEPGAA